MFIILRKNFNGRIYDRYFKSRLVAEKELDNAVEQTCKILNGEVVKEHNYFKREKGFYIYEKEAIFPDGETCVWALIDAFFEDE